MTGEQLRHFVHYLRCRGRLFGSGSRIVYNRRLCEAQSSICLSLLIGLAAAAGLAWLVIENPPTRPNVALAIVLLVAAATGLLAPLLAWLHRLIPFGGRPPVRRAAFRQAFFIGLALRVGCAPHPGRSDGCDLVAGHLGASGAAGVARANMASVESGPLEVMIAPLRDFLPQT